jgi:hypothetical protein
VPSPNIAGGLEPRRGGWRRGQERAAIALEELWNELAETRSFALLCGYHLDIFEVDVQREALPDLLRAHSHAHTVEEPSRLASAVDQALAEVIGPFQAARIYLDVAEHVPRGSLPRAQAVLSWLSSGEAPLAHEILQRARMHYARLTARGLGGFGGMALVVGVRWPFRGKDAGRPCSG